MRMRSYLTPSLQLIQIPQKKKIDTSHPINYLCKAENQLTIEYFVCSNRGEMR